MNSKATVNGIASAIMLLLMAGCPAKKNGTASAPDKQAAAPQAKKVELEQKKDEKELLKPETTAEEPAIEFAKPGRILVVNIHGMDENASAHKKNFGNVASLCKPSLHCTPKRFVEFYPEGTFVAEAKNDHKRNWFDMAIRGEELNTLLAEISGAVVSIRAEITDKDGKILPKIKKEWEESTVGTAEAVLEAYKAKGFKQEPTGEELRAALGIDEITSEAAMRIINGLWPSLPNNERSVLTKQMGDILGQRLEYASKQLAIKVKEKMADYNKTVVPKKQIPEGNVVIIGYSQGAMVAWALGHKIPALAVIGIKGSWVPGVKMKHKPKSAYVIAGKQDDIFSPEVLEGTVEVLEHILDEENVKSHEVDESHTEHAQTREVVANILAEISQKAKAKED